MTRFTFTLDCIIDYKHNTSSSARELQSVKAAERQAQQQCRAMAQAGLTLTCEECPRTFGIGDYRSEKSLRAALRMHGLKHRRDREKAAATG